MASSGLKRLLPSTPLLFVPIGALIVAMILPVTPLLRALIVGIPLAIVAIPLRRHFLEGWKARAAALGLTYDGKDPFDTRNTVPMPLFATNSARGSSLTMHGTWNGMEVRAFSYFYRMSGDSRAEYACALTPVPIAGAPLHIGRAAPWEKIVDELDLKQVRFELGTFNDQYGVYTTDPYFATTVVDQRMMDWLLTMCHPQWDFQIAGGWLMCMRDRYRSADTNYQDYGPILEALASFRQQIPTVAYSLFGPG